MIEENYLSIDEINLEKIYKRIENLEVVFNIAFEDENIVVPQKSSSFGADYEDDKL